MSKVISRTTITHTRAHCKQGAVKMIVFLKISMNQSTKPHTQISWRWQYESSIKGRAKGA